MIHRLRPSLIVPFVVLGCAALPVLTGGCGSTSNVNNTSQFRSVPNTMVRLTLNWPDYVAAPPTLNPTPAPTATSTATPNPAATPAFTNTDATGGLVTPAGALSAVITLSSSDPDTGSVVVLPPINRDDAKPGAYSETYVSAREVRSGTTNANVRFYDAKDGKGNALADSQRLAITINEDGTGLESLPLTIPFVAPTPSGSPSASP